ncbi:MAG: hypothetical protein R3E01_23645 [Pirellulaceae bacterium]|nr:hypothetical protein [Planctomycetales bacterium]
MRRSTSSPGLAVTTIMATFVMVAALEAGEQSAPPRRVDLDRIATPISGTKPTGAPTPATRLSLSNGQPTPAVRSEDTSSNEASPAVATPDSLDSTGAAALEQTQAMTSPSDSSGAASPADESLAGDSTWDALQSTPAESTNFGGNDEGGHHLLRSATSQRMLDIRRRMIDDDIGSAFHHDGRKPASNAVTPFEGQLPVVPKRKIESTLRELEPVEDPLPARQEVLEPELVPSEAVPAPATEPLPTAVPEPELAEPVAPYEGVEREISAPQYSPIPTRPLRNNLPSGNNASPSHQQLPTMPIAPAEPQNDPNVLFSRRAPSLSFETIGPRQITIGKEATYRVTMINTGNVDARFVEVSVTVPPWAEVLGHRASIGHPAIETDDEQNTLIRWNLDDLGAAGRENLDLTIIPRQSRPFELAVGWQLKHGNSMAQIEVQEPKLEMTVQGPGEVLYGDTKLYTITLSNPGTGTAENVVLNLLPVTPGRDNGGARRIGDIEAGQHRTIELELTAQQAGKLEVKAQAYADNGLRTEGSREVVVRRAKLQLTIMGPPVKYAGTDALYKFRIENVGDADAVDAQTTVTLPAGAQYLSSSDAGKYDEKQGTVHWRIGALRPGTARVLDLQCVLQSAGDNRMTLHIDGSGDLVANKSAVTRVEALADLKLYVNDPPGAVLTGTDSAYEVKIVNRGTKAAENIQVIGYFSRGIEPVSVQGWRGDLQPGQVVFAPIGRLTAGQELVFKITARAYRPGNHVFRAEVECAAPETRLAAEEWTKYYGEAIETNQVATEPDPTVPQLELRR